jgi:hypothetical protein
MPVVGIDPAALRRDFRTPAVLIRRRWTSWHPVARRYAAHDGVRKFRAFRRLTVYVFDEEQRLPYYAHLDGHSGLHEGQKVRAGDLLGIVGTTGNAPKDAPHLHFAVTRLDPDRKWWTGTPMDPFDLLTALRAPG